MKIVGEALLLLAGISSMWDIVQAMPSENSEEIGSEVNLEAAGDVVQASCTSYTYELVTSTCMTKLPCSPYKWTSRVSLGVGQITSQGPFVDKQGSGCTTIHEFAQNELKMTYTPSSSNGKVPLMGQAVFVQGQSIPPIDNRHMEMNTPNLTPGQITYDTADFKGADDWLCMNEYKISCL
eukprot:Clim_evm48s240 gene=Clim_evmTU48s240